MIVKRYSNGEQVRIDGGASIDVASDGMLLLAGVKVIATAQQINALAGMIDANGNLIITDTYWDDLRFPATGINPPGAASDPTRDTSDGRLVFSATQDNVIAIQVQIPHAWAQGTTIHPHVHWSPADANAGNVRWQLQYKVANIGEAFPGSWTTAAVTAAAGLAADKHQLTELAEIDMTGKTFSCMLLMIVSRLGSDPLDTYAGTVKLNEVDIHFEIDSLGSAQEYVK